MAEHFDLVSVANSDETCGTTDNAEENPYARLKDTHLLMEARDTIDIVKGKIDPWKDAHLHEPSLARGDWQH